MMIYLSMIETLEDRDKFEQIYLKYKYLMVHIAKKFVSSNYDAEDIVHHVFVSIIKNIDTISEIDSPKTRSYIVLITERKAIDFLRTSHQDKIVSLNEAITGMTFPEPGDHGIADVIARLPAQYREVLMLRFDNGFTTKEMAKMFGITESGVRKLIGRARKALEAELEKEEIVL